MLRKTGEVLFGLFLGIALVIAVQHLASAPQEASASVMVDYRCSTTLDSSGYFSTRCRDRDRGPRVRCRGDVTGTTYRTITFRCRD